MISNLLVLLIAVTATDAAPDNPYQVGNCVVVMKETALQSPNELDLPLSVGTTLAVEEIDGKLLGVTTSRRGWIDSADVATPDDAVEQLSKEVEADPHNAKLRKSRVEIALVACNFDVLIDDYNELIRQNPGDTELYYYRGNVWAQKQQPEKALADFNELLDRAPGEPQALLARAMLLYSKDDWQKSNDDLKELLKQPLDGKTKAKVLRYYADNCESLNHFDTAMESYNKLLALAPDDSRAHKHRAGLWYMLGEYKKAISDYSICIMTDPTDADSYAARGDCYRMLYNDSKANADLNRSLQLDPKNIRAIVMRGEMAESQKDFDLAISNFDRAIELDPKDNRAYAARAVVRARKGDTEKAEADIDEALKLDPQSAYNWFYKGSLRETEHKPDEALEAFSHALRLKPQFAEARQRRIDVNFEKKRYADVESDLEVFAAIDPQLIWLPYSRGSLRMAQKRFGEAVSEYTEAMRRDPKSAACQTARGRAYLGQREFEKALQDYNDALKLEPDSVEAANEVAWILAACPDEHLRDGKRAVELAQHVVSLDHEKSAYVMGSLAAAYAETGDFELAVATQQKALALKPDGRAKKLLERNLALFEKHQPARLQEATEVD